MKFRTIRYTECGYCVGKMSSGMFSLMEQMLNIKLCGLIS